MEKYNELDRMAQSVISKTEMELTYKSKTEVELTYKSKIKASDRPLIKSSSDSAAILRCHWDLSKIELQEQFCVLYLNRANRVLAIYKLSTGGISGTVADPRLILAAALKLVACAVILSHSHPSGNLKPSQADVQLTSKIKLAADYHDIKALDHIIITTEEYLSFAD